MNRFLLALLALSLLQTTSSNAQNVGIGNLNPQYKLDVNGRMRLMHANGQTAGLWLDGPSTPTRGFIGTMNENYVGIYGNGGASWNFVMNVINGNTGIGTTAPTATLDVNGSLRYRSGGSFPGAQLISTDNDGNASWQQPISFAISGLADGSNINTSGSYIYFNILPDYNYGFAYFPGSSSFEVNTKGIYHFDVMLLGFSQNQTSEVGSLRLERTRNSIKTELIKSNEGHNTPEAISQEHTFTLSGDFLLNAGDVIRVYFGSTHSWQINGGANEARFSGRLVQRVN